MLCEKCHRREANVCIAEIVGGTRYEQNLCMECAREQTSQLRQLLEPGGDMMEKIAKVLHRLNVVGVVVSPNMSLDTTLGEKVDLEQLGLKLPGSDVSGEGCQTCTHRDTAALRSELAAAVATENFEKAAQLRDEIYKLEKGS